ncbi:Glycosyltransferase involved in cell wall bisynthesis [Micromonospora echinaurantiaca]|uniref:4,4'-diaponeurosporenoate glycosyltransferase n=1 Tax=Micromonospora echinaurantiaca TaxID=47857 RepID=A0A1C5IN79_9ACTN|nr:glycosyltransferase [Micromonospora echinaurantiaca]SCG59266.1 Glycosyltransferase involved in cell wall bisynthesis [Micromonospora echinaurantiaca]
MTSVVIAAYNEEAVIGRCLDALLADAPPDPLDITVVANGCTDATAAVARERAGVRVLDLPGAGKAAALNAGDATAVGFPRVYLDADVVLSPGALRAFGAALDRPVDGRGGDPPLAVVPGRSLDLTGRPTPVRAYYAINSRLPAFRHSLFGRGAIALSAAGRARFDTFPAMTADDLFLDGLFAPYEKRELDGVLARLATPRRTGDLVRRLVRVRAGNAELRAAAARGAVATVAVRRTARSSWLRDVVLPRPWLAPAAACYVGITLVAALRARRELRAGGGGWGRDGSSREPALADAESDGQPPSGLVKHSR